MSDGFWGYPSNRKKGVTNTSVNNIGLRDVNWNLCCHLQLWRQHMCSHNLWAISNPNNGEQRSQREEGCPAHRVSRLDPMYVLSQSWALGFYTDQGRPSDPPTRRLKVFPREYIFAGGHFMAVECLNDKETGNHTGLPALHLCAQHYTDRKFLSHLSDRLDISAFLWVKRIFLFVPVCRWSLVMTQV